MAKFAAKDSNKNITLSPHGTGKVVVGTGAADATVQSDGNHNLVLQTGNSTTGSISITDGADGDIAISPNGTGTVVVNTDLDVDNININGNAITSTNTNGNIDVTPNGTGQVNISDLQVDNIRIDDSSITSTNTNGDINLTPNGTGQVAISDLQVDNIRIDDSSITSTNTDGDINLTPNGSGQVNISHLQVDNIRIDDSSIYSTNTNGDINLAPNGTGEVNISKVDIDSGAIDGVTIGTNSVVTDLQVDNIRIDGSSITSTNTDGDINLTPNGTGGVNISKFGSSTAFPSGHVIQTKTDTFDPSSDQDATTTADDILGADLQVTITPNSTSNKLVVTCFIGNIYTKGIANHSIDAGFKYHADWSGTPNTLGSREFVTNQHMRHGTSDVNMVNFYFQTVADAPVTTQIIIRPWFKTNTGNVRLFDGAAVSQASLTVMEIQA